jgi:hypothetical protein
MTHVEHKIPVQNVVFPGGLGVWQPYPI